MTDVDNIIEINKMVRAPSEKVRALEELGGKTWETTV